MAKNRNRLVSRDSVTTSNRDRSIRRPEQEERYSVLKVLADEYSDRAMDHVMDRNNYYYAGIDPRRRQEVADSGMIREDHNAMANLPRMAQHHEWPTVSYYQNFYIDSMVEEE